MNFLHKNQVEFDYEEKEDEEQKEEEKSVLFDALEDDNKFEGDEELGLDGDGESSNDGSDNDNLDNGELGNGELDNSELDSDEAENGEYDGGDTSESGDGESNPLEKKEKLLKAQMALIPFGQLLQAQREGTHSVGRKQTQKREHTRIKKTSGKFGYF